MHLYAFVKGHHQHVEKWANDLSSVWVPLYKDGKKLIDKDGKQQVYQLGVGPVQLMEIRFPQEALESVMNIVGTGNYVYERYPILRKMKNAFVKLMGLKKVPKPKNPDPLWQPNQMNKAVAVMPIGLKEDEIHHGYEQL